MRLKQKNKKGFTLIELLIVMGIMAILFAATITGVANAQRVVVFNNNFEQLINMVRIARSYAITGKAVADATNYTGDANNQVTPAHFGVNYKDNIASLFADIHANKTNNIPVEGEYQPCDVTNIFPGCDILMDQLDLNGNKLKISLTDEKNNSSSNTNTVLFTPLYADISFNPALPNNSFALKIKMETTDQPVMSRCILLNNVSGIPEETSC